ncbi:phospholipase A2 inhibitor subunit A [Crotalus adamanteus]|uniref:Phospholipase A2 inhibitor subunit A n=1 Tax=Crotalus adamanteus TaxID=8729 RepID=A0AAW1BER9_CROAD
MEPHLEQQKAQRLKMRLILLSSLLLLGTFLANGKDADPEGQVLNSVLITLMKLQREFTDLYHAFLTVHKARSFGSGSERLYVSNKEIKSFEDLKVICKQAGGQIPSPQLENQNKAFANVLERHDKEAFLVVGDSANFTNWAAGQPNKADGTCVKADTHGFWHSASCDDNLLVVCEFYFIL